MIEPEEIHKMLTAAFPGAEITVQDTTGTRDHFYVTVLWDGFMEKKLIAQHQMVNKALRVPLANESIHALQLKTAALSR